MAFISVDLPEPLGPMTAVMPPGAAENDTSCRIRRLPRLTESARTSIMASPGKSGALAHQDPEEEWSANGSRDDADRQLGWRDDQAADGVGHQQEGSAQQGRRG